jgi:ribosomal protein L16 Arg81 hydroxylase
MQTFDQINYSADCVSSPSLQLLEKIMLMLADHVSDQEILEALSLEGFHPEDIQPVLSEYGHHPLMRLCQHLSLNLKKRNHSLDVAERIHRSSRFWDTIERIRDLSQPDFLERYYSTNRPVILQGMVVGTQPFSLITLQSLKERFGNVEVEIQDNRSSVERYEEYCRQLVTHIRFSDFIDRVIANPVSNEFYMTSNNMFANEHHFSPLWKEHAIFPQFLDSKKLDDAVPSLWVGPGGTVTPLHQDICCNSLFVQIEGRKKFTLISPAQTPYLYDHTNYFSPIDVEKPDYERYPLYRNVRPLNVIVEPGEVLFIPAGWWHQVRALETSISMSFTNFSFDQNVYPSFSQKYGEIETQELLSPHVLTGY